MIQQIHQHPFSLYFYPINFDNKLIGYPIVIGLCL